MYRPLSVCCLVRTLVWSDFSILAKRSNCIMNVQQKHLQYVNRWIMGSNNEHVKRLRNSESNYNFVRNDYPFFNCYMCIRRHSSGFQKNRNNIDSRLLYAVYLSGFIGVLLVGAIIKREVVDRARNRFKGIEEIESPLAKGRFKMYKYKDVVLPSFVLKYLQDSSLDNFEIRDDDIWIVSYPRSGTTLTMEITYLITSGLNFTCAREELLESRVPYLEYTMLGLKSIDALPSPRIIKSHLPLRLLPKQIHEKKPKILYIARNPKDVLVSYYHYFKLLRSVTHFTGKIEEFFDGFIHDKVPYNPWWRHIKEFWEIKEEDNILFLTYEDLIKDPIGSIQSIGLFLGKQLSEVEIQQIAQHCHFDKMKVNSSTNYSHLVELGVFDKDDLFIRKGVIGDWRNSLSPDMSQKLDRMVALKLQNTGLTFDYGQPSMNLQHK